MNITFPFSVTQIDAYTVKVDHDPAGFPPAVLGTVSPNELDKIYLAVAVIRVLLATLKVEM